MMSRFTNSRVDESATAGVDRTARRRIGGRTLTWGAGAAVILGVIGATAAIPVPANAAVALTASTHATTHPCAVELRAVKREYDKLPSAMSSAIKSADKAAKGSAREDARKAVLTNAKNGTYGEEAKSVAADAKSLEGFRVRWDRLPSSLRDALKADKGATGTTRQSDLTALLNKAESGAYGSRVEDAVKPLESKLTACIAKIGASGTTSTPSAGGAATSTPAPTSTTGA